MTKQNERQKYTDKSFTKVHFKLVSSKCNTFSHVRQVNRLSNAHNISTINTLKKIYIDSVTDVHE